MAIFTEPKKWGVIPGSAADVGEIQEKGSALYPSIADLWPAIYQLALSKGGKAPERTGFNAFLKMIMERLYFIERGGVWSYDAAADYPAGAVVGYSGSLYLALKDNGSGTDAGAVTPGENPSVWQKLVLESGNAATATKLATARTIALSGAATGTATGFDGSGNITIPVTELSGSAITSAITIYDLVPDGAASHRNFYRGKDITAAFNAGTVSANIANGTFRDIFPGDYITKSVTVPQILKADGTTEYIAQTTYTVRFIIADLDVWLSRGDTATTAHHVAIVPERAVFSSCMNETNTTEGGYFGSFMNTNVMPAFATGLQNAFGSAHILQFRFVDTKVVSNDLKSGGVVNYTGATYWGGFDWASHYCHLMTEAMVYGAPITASCAADEVMGGVQFAAFRLNSNLVYNRQHYWLSDVVSSANFAGVYGYGDVYADGASYLHGVRPFALLV